MDLKDRNEDFEWIKKYKRCHQEPLNKLINKYYRYSYKSFVYRGLPQKDAEDCTQDIWIRLVRTLKQFNFESSFKTFLDRAIKFRSFDFYRSLKKRFDLISLYIRLFNDDSELELIDTIPSGEFDGPEQNHNYQKLVRILEKCIEKITKQPQKELVALWLDGHTRKQMAEILELPLGTVHGGLERGKVQLRNCVKKNYC